VDGDRAERILRSGRAEFHDATFTAGASTSASSRSRSVICAMIASGCAMRPTSRLPP